MKAVILGGSFNPVHVGHLILAEEALDALDADVAYLIPAAHAPHKDKPAGASDGDRLEMLRRSVAGDERMRVLSCELDRGGTSYTVDTLSWLRREGLADERPYLLLGDDLVAGFGSWREPDTVASMARIVLAHRNSAEHPPFRWPHERIENSLIPVSSTRVRELAASGRPFRYLVPPAAFEYIRSHGLYGTDGERGA